MEGEGLAKVITSLEEAILEEELPGIEKEIREFVLGLLLDNGARFDVVIGADRKGIRILKEIIGGHAETIACKVMSDGQIEPGALRGTRILVFDDSIHTGKKVLDIIDEVIDQGPKSITVACLLANLEGVGRIEGAHHDVKVHTCVPIFERYDDQAKKYISWIMPFMSQLGNKDNPDYPALKLETDGRDIDRLARTMAEVLISLVTPKDQGVYWTEGARSRSISVDVEPGPNVLPKPYDSVAEPDGTKIRCTVIDRGTKAEITVIPMISPRFDSSKCDIWSTAQEKCLFKLLKAERDDALCKVCIPVLLNTAFINDNIGKMLSKLQEKDILVNKYWVEMPHLKRFGTRQAPWWSDG